MPRRPRIKLADIPQHIVQRGINREPYFYAEEDYHGYLHWLEKAAVDWHCDIHAYVLMTNHVHLLVTPATETGAAKLMQSVGAQQKHKSILDSEQERMNMAIERKQTPLVA